MQYLEVSERHSLVEKDLIDMSHIATASSTGRTSPVARFTTAVRKSWADARYADRRLMEMRTNLSRHSG